MNIELSDLKLDDKKSLRFISRFDKKIVNLDIDDFYIIE